MSAIKNPVLDNNDRSDLPPVAAPVKKVAAKAEDSETPAVSSSPKSDASDATPQLDDGDMSGMRLFLMMTKGVDGAIGSADVEAVREESDQDFASKFKTFVADNHLEEAKVTVDGKETTFGALADRLSTEYGQSSAFSGLPQGILGQARISSFSGLSGQDLGAAEQLAQKRGVLGAIQYAANTVGADVGFMLSVAKQESGFNASAKAGTSSATGLYQFTTQTWEGMLAKHSDTLRKAGFNGELMGLRTNALANALMGAELYRDNKRFLEEKLPGIHVGNTEIYMANFLGQGGAVKFLTALRNNPEMSASSAMASGQAGANSFIGNKSALGLYEMMASKVSSEGYSSRMSGSGIPLTAPESHQIHVAATGHEDTSHAKAPQLAAAVVPSSLVEGAKSAVNTVWTSVGKWFPSLNFNG